MPLYNIFTIYTRLMLRHNFCRPNGRLVKLFLFSTVLDKSPLNSIYFTTFEKKSQVSPIHTAKLFGFWYIQYTLYSIHCIHLCTNPQLVIITTAQTFTGTNLVMRSTGARTTTCAVPSNNKQDMICIK